jgi:putative component of membrane protein insertase Oxa1/YidC/SpoIIIJ protein YidD
MHAYIHPYGEARSPKSGAHVGDEADKSGNARPADPGGTARPSTVICVSPAIHTACLQVFACSASVIERVIRMSFASSNIQASLLALAKCTTNMLFVQILDLISSAVLPASCLHAPSGSHSGQPFVAYQPDFLKLLAAPALSVLCHSEDGLPLFHEAGKSILLPASHPDTI